MGSEAIAETSPGDSATTHAIAYIDLFCATELAKAQCRILSRQVKILEVELSTPTQRVVVPLNVGELRSLQAEIESILADARVVTLPIITSKVKTEGETITVQLEELKACWLPVRAALYEVSALHDDPALGRWAETTWVGTWGGLRLWYWLSAVTAILTLVVCAYCQFRPDILRILRSGQVFASVIVVVCALAMGAVLLFACCRTFLWTEGHATLDRFTGLQDDPPRPRKDADLIDLRAQYASIREAYSSLLLRYQPIDSSWQQKVIATIPFGALLPSRVLEFRRAVWRSEADFEVVRAVAAQLEADSAELKTLKEDILQSSRWERQQMETLSRHHLTTACFLLLSSTFLVVVLAYLARRHRVGNSAICPACGVTGRLVGSTTPGKRRWPELWARHKKGHGNRSGADPDDIAKVPMLRCAASIKGFACEYQFAAAYSELPRITIPTCGAAETGKTMWLGMVYQQLTHKTCHTRPRFERLRLAHGDDLESAIENILNQRRTPTATKTDRIPRPLVFKVDDGHWATKSSVLLSLLDFPGEMTNAWSIDDSRKRRALQVNGVLYFLDPTKSHPRQVNELQAFIQDLRLVRRTPDRQRESIPLAVCLCKIDELTRLSTASSQKAVARFFERLREADPGNRPPSRKTIRLRSKALLTLWEEMWPGWRIASLVKDEFRGPWQLFPLTPIGLERGGDTDSELGKADLRKRTLSPFGLLEPLLWLMHLNGVNAL